MIAQGLATHFLTNHGMAGALVKDLVLFGIVLAVVVIAKVVAGRQIRRRERSEVLNILPPDGAELVMASWPAFFRGLFGMARPWWKRWLVGQATITFEFVAQDGAVQTRCVCPQSLRPLMVNLLNTALPGVEVVDAPD